MSEWQKDLRPIGTEFWSKPLTQWNTNELVSLRTLYRVTGYSKVKLGPGGPIRDAESLEVLRCQQRYPKTIIYDSAVFTRDAKPLIEYGEWQEVS